MNERFQALAKEAENYAAEQNDKFGVSYKKTYNEKFAELIVRECSSICRGVGDAVWAEQHQSNIGTARTCELAIQKHFGVGE